MRKSLTGILLAVASITLTPTAFAGPVHYGQGRYWGSYTVDGSSFVGTASRSDGVKATILVGCQSGSDVVYVDFDSIQIANPVQTGHLVMNVDGHQYLVAVSDQFSGPSQLIHLGPIEAISSYPASFENFYDTVKFPGSYVVNLIKRSNWIKFTVPGADFRFSMKGSTKAIDQAFKGADCQ